MNQVLGQIEELEIEERQSQKTKFNKNKAKKQNKKKKNIFEKILIIGSILIILGLASLRNLTIWTISWI